MSLSFPEIDPVALQLGPFAIRWYSLGYIGGLALGWWYALSLLKKPTLWPDKAGPPLTRVQLDDIIFWVAIGVMAGGRLGYVLFYDPSLLTASWGKLFGVVPFPPALMLWHGGMSFHGGLLGVTIAGFLFCRKHKLAALSVGDLFACAAPIGIFLVRIANFVNGELYGRPWDGPWAMKFPTMCTDPIRQGCEVAGKWFYTGLEPTRHPSQLYEAALEGLVLFVVIRIAIQRFALLKRPGATIGLFLAGYAASRIFVENFRQPDTGLENLPLGLTMGMYLSTPMLLTGLWLIWRTYNNANARKAAAK
ncbi:MAG: prolipoprotein diacylglyceryl transferase [Pseudomonadota bacterium]